MKKHYIGSFPALLLLFVIFLITGCGFHLRIQTITASQLKELNIVSSDSNFSHILKRKLLSAGVQVLPSAPYNIKINAITISPTTQLQATQSITNYTLSGRVTWTLETASGQPLFMPRTITQNISYQIISDVNISSSYDNQARKELNEALASLIIRQLGAITPKELDQWKKEADTQAEQQADIRRQSMQSEEGANSSHVLIPSKSPQ